MAGHDGRTKAGTAGAQGFRRGNRKTPGMLLAVVTGGAFLPEHGWRLLGRGQSRCQDKDPDPAVSVIASLLGHGLSRELSTILSPGGGKRGGGAPSISETRRGGPASLKPSEEEKTVKRTVHWLALACVLLGLPLAGTGLADIVPEQERLEQQVRHELLMLPFFGVFDDLSFTIEGRSVVLTGQVTRPVLASSAVQVVKGI